MSNLSDRNTNSSSYFQQYMNTQEEDVSNESSTSLSDLSSLHSDLEAGFLSIINILNNYTPTEESNTILLNELNKFINANEYRIAYNTLYNFVLKPGTTAEQTVAFCNVLIANIDWFYKFLLANQDLPPSDDPERLDKITNFLLKLINHLNLVMAQVLAMESLDKSSRDSVKAQLQQELENNKNKLTEQLEENKQEITKQLQHQAEELLQEIDSKRQELAQSIEANKQQMLETERSVSSKTMGYLIAFTALAFLIFGNLMTLEKVTNITESNLLNTLISMGLWGLICVTMIFVFLSFIEKISSDKPSSGSSSHGFVSCLKCLAGYKFTFFLVHMGLFAAFIFLIILKMILEPQYLQQIESSLPVFFQTMSNICTLIFG